MRFVRKAEVAMIIQDDVTALLAQVSLPPEHRLLRGASDAAIATFEQECGFALPPEQRGWLRLCNGALAGPGGLLGINPDPPWLDIGVLYRLIPQWLDNRWIPVADDGCGNYYVLDAGGPTSESHPVYFIDHERGYDAPAYRVASGLWQFLWFLLTSELERGSGIRPKWPFDHHYVLEHDPEIGAAPCAVPLPWDAR
jgi:hypothetical protein